MSEYTVQFICGCLSGWAQVLTMQPFQIIKVRLVNQSLNNPSYKGIFDCLTKIYFEEGLKAFYKGTLSPLIGNGGQVALQFGTNQLIKKVMVKMNVEETPGETLPMSFILLSGVLTGIPSSLAVTPIDHTRIKMQNKQTKYKSSISAGIEITKKYGIRGLYQGFWVTMLREVIALGVYFGSYEYMIKQLNQRNRKSPPSPMVSFFAGGVAGCLSWLFTYPIDYLKTVVQSDPLEKRQFISATQAALIKYREQGVRTFFKGLGVTLLRSFPVNGIGFLTFQYCRSYLSKSKQL